MVDRTVWDSEWPQAVRSARAAVSWSETNCRTRRPASNKRNPRSLRSNGTSSNSAVKSSRSNSNKKRNRQQVRGSAPAFSSADGRPRFWWKLRHLRGFSELDDAPGREQGSVAADVHQYAVLLLDKSKFASKISIRYMPRTFSEEEHHRSPLSLNATFVGALTTSV